MKYDRKCADCLFADLTDLSGKHFYCKKLRISVLSDRKVCFRFKSIYQPGYIELDFLYDLGL